MESAEGVRLRLAGGREVVDGMSSWWAAVHGYRHPVLDAALAAQAGRMSHVMFGGLTHRSAVELAEALVTITPEPLDTVFFSDSGSVSVEVAVKMALQYHRARGDTQRRRLATWRGGYHGDTFTPMSVCDPVGGMHSLWGDVLNAQVFAPEPPVSCDSRYETVLADVIGRHAHELAAVIVEPVVQGAGGMRFHDPAALVALRRICDATGVLLIFDEIATGFGRSGELFAADHAGVAPDVMCVGKALTGGYLSLAATLATREVAETISAGDPGLLAHGPTFMGNPLATAVALASTRLLVGDDLTGDAWRGDVARVEVGLRAGLAPLTGVDGVADVRVLGAIGVVQLDRAVDVAAATSAALEAGVWLRPFRDLIYAMPPYISTAEDVATITAGMSAAVRASLGVQP